MALCLQILPRLPSGDARTSGLIEHNDLPAKKGYSELQKCFQ
jgi:hypothetical protein